MKEEYGRVCSGIIVVVVVVAVVVVVVVAAAAAAAAVVVIVVVAVCFVFLGITIIPTTNRIAEPP